MSVNKYIFYKICDKNIDTYMDIIKTIKEEYINNIKLLRSTIDCKVIRQIIHKLIGIVSILNGTNIEITFLLKTLLDVDKNTEDYSLYKEYINNLIQYETSNLF